MISDKKKARNRAYYLKNQAELIEYSRIYRQEHPEQVKVSAQNYREKNRERIRADARTNYQVHRAEQLAQSRAYGQAIKLEVFNAYGGARCACCDEAHLEFLSLDHIWGGGGLHRSQLRTHGGVNLYNILKRQGYPLGFRVLCMNCNFALGNFGYCPHGNVKVEPKLAITQNGHSHGPQQFSLGILA